MVRVFSDFLIFYQILHLPQVKQSVVDSNKKVCRSCLTNSGPVSYQINKTAQDYSLVPRRLLEIKLLAILVQNYKNVDIKSFP